jgi:hypothetical protein
MDGMGGAAVSKSVLGALGGMDGMGGAAVSKSVLGALGGMDGMGGAAVSKSVLGALGGMDGMGGAAVSKSVLGALGGMDGMGGAAVSKSVLGALGGMDGMGGAAVSKSVLGALGGMDGMGGAAVSKSVLGALGGMDAMGGAAVSKSMLGALGAQMGLDAMTIGVAKTTSALLTSALESLKILDVATVSVYPKSVLEGLRSLEGATAAMSRSALDNLKRLEATQIGSVLEGISPFNYPFATPHLLISAAEFDKDGSKRAFIRGAVATIVVADVSRNIATKSANIELLKRVAGTLEVSAGLSEEQRSQEIRSLIAFVSEWLASKLSRAKTALEAVSADATVIIVLTAIGLVLQYCQAEIGAQALKQDVRQTEIAEQSLKQDVRQTEIAEQTLKQDVRQTELSAQQTEFMRQQTEIMRQQAEIQRRQIDASENVVAQPKVPTRTEKNHHDLPFMEVIKPTAARTGHKTSSPIVARLCPEQIVMQLKIYREWVLVQTYDSISDKHPQGWVRKKYLRLKDTPN